MTTMTKPDHSAKNGQLEVLDRKQSALEGGGGGAWDKTSLCSLCTEAEDRWHRAATRQQDARRTRCPWLKEPKPRGW